MPKTKSFDEHSHEYDQWFDEHSEIYEAELAVIREFMCSYSGNGLEVGIGTGRFAIPLGITTGIEPSVAMAAIAAKSGISVFSAVAEQLPFEDNQFDLVLMVTVICFLDDVLQAFKEAFRVLKPGGYILVGFIDKESVLGRQYMEKREKSLFYQDAVFYSAPEVLSFLRQAGFSSLVSKQTLIPASPNDTILDGYGQGAFVVMQGIKDKNTNTIV
ncbi:MAG: class I SAM-dependent methyltransferase [Gammaproteobacteria bacterium]|nr:class I SAM-dependent methyltransferase [Gammaproteobacteria bacterium]